MKRVTTSIGCSMLVAATLAFCPVAFAQPAPKKTEKAESFTPQGYSVVLVLGDTQSTSATDGNVPPAARKALTDMKDFLPYKSYTLLDAQWILGSQRTVSRLRGPNDQRYELTLRGVSVAPAGKLNVTFRLAEPSATTMITARPVENDALAARLASLQNALREAQALSAKIRDARDEKSAEESAAAKERVTRIAREIVQLEQEASMKDALIRAAHAVIDTSFTMDIGETVVVGTSRVAGDKALIALLTAVPHK